MSGYKPLCVPCKREMFPAKNSVNVLFHASFGPYQVIQGDMWECPNCHAQIISGWGRGPLAEHFEEDFATVAATCTLEVPA